MSTNFSYAHNFSNSSKAIKDLFSEYSNIIDQLLEYIYVYETVSVIESEIDLIDAIYDNLPDSKFEKINYTKLLEKTLYSLNISLFKKYIFDALDHNCKIDLKSLCYTIKNLQQYFEEKDLEFLFDLMVYLGENINPNFPMAFELFSTFSFTRTNQVSKFFIDETNEKLLNRIPEGERKKICLMPYCSNLETYKKLLEYGFNVNQKDKNGNTLLFNLFKYRDYKIDEDDYYFNPIYKFDNEERKLAEYISSGTNSSIKNNEGLSPLFAALGSLYANKDISEGFREESDKEIATTSLILDMKKEDICDPMIYKIIAYRFNLSIDDETADLCKKYNYIRDLFPSDIPRYYRSIFEALIEKGFVMREELINSIYKAYDQIPSSEEFNDNDQLYTFVYEFLDRNLDIPNLNINHYTDFIVDFIENSDFKDNYSSILKLKEYLVGFNSKIIDATIFLNNAEWEKRNPEGFIEYAWYKYGICCGTDFSSYFYTIFVKINQTFEKDLVSELLEICTAFDAISINFDDNGYGDCNDEKRLVKI